MLETWVDFLPLHVKKDVLENGLEPNKKLILSKIEETKQIGALNEGRDDNARDSEED